MRKSTIILGIMIALLSHVARAEISQQVIEAIFIMQSLCLARSELTIEAKGGGSILLLKKGAQVEGEYKETEIPSLLKKLQGEVSLMQEASEIRKCMSPHIDKILDYIGPPPSRSNKNSTNYPQPPSGFSIDKEGFMLSPNRERICESQLVEPSRETVTYYQGMPMTTGHGAIYEEKCKFFDGSWVKGHDNHSFIFRP